jgi:transposase
MEVIHARCAGLDVHKTSTFGCVICCEANGKKRQEKRSFGTMTADLLSLADWLREQAVTHVAMEATGVYWRPVWAMLEGQFELMLVNPHHVQAIPGRKTDAKDCEWIAELLQHGLLRGSFVPPTEIQDLRDLTRYRVELTQAQNRVANRIQKLLEQANIKLSSVASNTLGVSGQQMIEAIIAGEEDPERLADLAQRRLREKIPELRLALEGRVRAHHRFLLKEFLEEWKALGMRIGRIEEEIDRRIAPFEEAATLWQSIPGMDRVTACNLVAEMGVNMAQFPSAQQLASWAGICPGNHESAGKRMSATTRDGNKWLRRTLCQAALGRDAQEGLLPFSAVPALGGPSRNEASSNGRGAHHADHRLHHAENSSRLPRTRRELSGADQSRSTPALFRKTTEKAWAYGDRGTGSLTIFSKENRTVMPQLVVVGFKKDMYRASEVLNKLQEMNDDWEVDLHDAVAVYRDYSGKLRVDQSYQATAGEGAGWGAFWGSLIGATLAIPFTGGASVAAVAGALAAGALGGGALGAGMGAIDASWWKDEFGIPDEFVKNVGAMVQPGDSAIYALLRTINPDVVFDQFRGYGGTVLSTTLDRNQQAKVEKLLSDR